MLWPYLKFWEWEWIFGRAVKAISSLGVRFEDDLRSGGLLYCVSHFDWSKLQKAGELVSWKILDGLSFKD